MTATVARIRPTKDPYGRRWPLQPLLAASRQSAEQLAVNAGFDRRSGSRWLHTGMVDVVADHVACAAGLPAALVWRDWCSGAQAEPC